MYIGFYKRYNPKVYTEYNLAMYKYRYFIDYYKNYLIDHRRVYLNGELRFSKRALIHFFFNISKFNFF